MGKFMDQKRKIEQRVVSGYQKMEDTVVGGYQKIENAVVGSYKKVEDKFVEAFLTPSDPPRQTETTKEEGGMKL